jgi:large subunit ribosomal protein L7/L12
MNKEQFIETIEKMTVLELSELIKTLEERFEVSAAMPVMAASFPSGSAPSEEKEKKEEKTNFAVELTSGGTQKIQVIKALREVISLGLKEAKDLVDAAPKLVKEGVSKEEAEEIKKKLEAAGAHVTLK